MLFDQNPELQIRAKRPTPLIVSIGVHALLILVIAFNPDWFDFSQKRIIRIAGEDFDLAKLEIQPLYLPPPATMRQAMPAPVAPPAVVAPMPQAIQPPPQAAPPPPPPPPQPPTPPPPDRVIRPDDQLIEGARPDGTTRPSRGNTQEPARNAAREAQDAREAQQALRELEEREAKAAAQRTQQAQRGNERLLPNNTNPNAMRAPGSNLLGSVARILEADSEAARRSQIGSLGRTGITRSDNNGTFSTDPQILSPNPKGIDFGPYLNHLLNRLRANWYTVMPEMARLGQKGRVDIVFTVTRVGNVKDLQIVVNSNYEPLDRAALSAIQLSNPFQHLPAEYETDLKLRIAFLYNMNP
jgi:TonB family protein